ncbi:type I-E CRISPR-associated protein Cse2/CasB [Streptomyces sp. NPDC002851]
MSTHNSADTADASAQRRERLLQYTARMEQLCRDDPGARSALRSGLRRALNDRRSYRMHRFITPWLSRHGVHRESAQRAYYTVAAMIASQPRSSPASTVADEEAGSGSAPPADHTAAAEEPVKEKRAARYGQSLGASFAVAVTGSSVRDKEMRESTAETRLNLLTRQSTEGLHRHLPAAVGYLRDLDVPVDWAQLQDDLMAWPYHSGRIARRWLQDYYRRRDEALRQQADDADRADATAAVADS